MWSFPQTKRAVSSLLSSEESPPTRPFPSPLPSPQVVGLRALLAVVTTVTESSAARSPPPPSLLVHPADLMSREKAHAWSVFRWALRCMPHLIPEQWRNDKMTEIIPVYAISVEPNVRHEALQVSSRGSRRGWGAHVCECVWCGAYAACPTSSWSSGRMSS